MFKFHLFKYLFTASATGIDGKFVVFFALEEQIEIIRLVGFGDIAKTFGARVAVGADDKELRTGWQEIVVLEFFVETI